ncbi:AAA family ATPase, partial [Clostridioides difficile]
QFIAQAITNGEKAFLYSGELPSFMSMDWFRKTVANDYHIKEYKSVYGGTYTDIPDYAVELISDWIEDKFFLYDEDAISDEVNLLNTIEHLYLKKGVRFFVLDNLMTIKTGNKADKYERQEQIVSNLKNLAKKYNLVIVLVAHPRKNMGDMKPTMYDVSGAS